MKKKRVIKKTELTLAHIKLFYVLILLCCFYLPVSAAGHSQSKHVIVAFDQSIGKYNTDLFSSKVLTLVDDILDKNDFDRANDYISMVAYTLNVRNPNLSDYVKPCTHNENAFIWQHLGSRRLTEILPSWPMGIPARSGSAADYASMQSLAKPFIVMETKLTGDDTITVDQTIILLISDNVVNGADDDYEREWKHVSTIPIANVSLFKQQEQTVFSKMRAFNEDFKFIRFQVNLSNNRASGTIPVSSDGTYCIIPYKVVPAERPSIHSVTDLPSPIPMVRVRGGFKVKTDPHSLKDKYSISHVEITDASGKQLAESRDGALDVLLKSNEVKAGDSICIKMSLRLKDGLYNGMRISGDNDGMWVKQAVKLQDEAKVIGLFPLSDSFWWWFPDDVFTAVMIWDLFLLLALIALVGFILYLLFVRINSYKPSNKNIKIEKI